MFPIGSMMMRNVKNIVRNGLMNDTSMTKSIAETTGQGKSWHKNSETGNKSAKIKLAG